VRINTSRGAGLAMVTLQISNGCPTARNTAAFIAQSPWPLAIAFGIAIPHFRSRGKRPILREQTR
jgi:hypothetical protein